MRVEGNFVITTEYSTVQYFSSGLRLGTVASEEGGVSAWHALRSEQFFVRVE